jgi:hypothetical protein
MIKKDRLASLVVVCAVGVACLSAIADAPHAERPTGSASTASIEAYRTPIFNLLSKNANVVDGKNYYRGDFAKQFDALLASSSLAKTDKTRVPLKKRLLSGPAPEPALQADLATGTQWIVYDACQAHRCDEISLRLLYDPASHRMVGKLNLDKQSEFLGTPSVSEQRLLERAQSK